MEAKIERAMQVNGMEQCSQCGEWIRTERLSDHRIWAHNVGGAVGLKYWEGVVKS
jgi:hypothetical protein